MYNRNRRCDWDINPGAGQEVELSQLNIEGKDVGGDKQYVRERSEASARQPGSKTLLLRPPERTSEASAKRRCCCFGSAAGETLCCCCLKRASENRRCCCLAVACERKKTVLLLRFRCRGGNVLLLCSAVALLRLHVVALRCRARAIKVLLLLPCPPPTTSAATRFRRRCPPINSPLAQVLLQVEHFRLPGLGVRRGWRRCGSPARLRADLGNHVRAAKEGSEANAPSYRASSKFGGEGGECTCEPCPPPLPCPPSLPPLTLPESLCSCAATCTARATT